MPKGLFEFMISEELPERVIGDKAYDSDELDQRLAQMGMEMIAPHRKNRRPENKTHRTDGLFAATSAGGWSSEQ